VTRDEILAAAQELARSKAPFVFATVDAEGAPQVRWMGGLVLDEPFQVWMMSGAQARKMAQIRGNPAAQLVFSTPDFSRVITVSGTCEVSEDLACKQRVWVAMPELAQFVSGPEDPDFGLVEFVGKRLELLAIRELGPEPLVAEL